MSLQLTAPAHFHFNYKQTSWLHKNIYIISSQLNDKCKIGCSTALLFFYQHKQTAIWSKCSIQSIHAIFHVFAALV